MKNNTTAKTHCTSCVELTLHVATTGHYKNIKGGKVEYTRTVKCKKCGKKKVSFHTHENKTITEIKDFNEDGTSERV